jgi:hypothetical protein
MAINFPTSLDTFPIESELNTTLGGENHALLHENLGSAVRALEVKVGIDSSSATPSHDYKIGVLEGPPTREYG